MVAELEEIVQRGPRAFGWGCSEFVAESHDAISLIDVTCSRWGALNLESEAEVECAKVGELELS